MHYSRTLRFVYILSAAHLRNSTLRTTQKDAAVLRNEGSNIMLRLVLTTNSKWIRRNGGEKANFWVDLIIPFSPVSFRWFCFFFPISDVTRKGWKMSGGLLSGNLPYWKWYLGRNIAKNWLVLTTWLSERQNVYCDYWLWLHYVPVFTFM